MKPKTTGGKEQSSYASNSVSNSTLQKDTKLDNLLIVNSLTAERYYANSDPVPFDTDLFSGLFLILVRTPDSDETPTNDGINDGGGGSNKSDDHFAGKNRRFEIQLQIKMKKVVDGQIFMGCELRDQLQLGMIQNAFVKTTLKSIQRRNRGFHFNIDGTSKKKEEAIRSGNYEYPHMAFTFDTCMDRIVITKPGEKPPLIGGVLHEDPESMKRRNNGTKIVFNTEDTYTVAMWSAYCDLIEWKCLNLSPIKPFPLQSIIDDQIFILSWYTLDSKDGHHYRCNMTTALELEFGHKKNTRTGTAAQRWMSSKKKHVKLHEHEPSLPLLLNKNTASYLSKGLTVKANGEEVEAFTNSYSKQDFGVNDYGGTGEDPEWGLYLKSGDPIFLRESSSSGELAFLTNAGGFAVLQNQTASTIVIEKVNPGRKLKCTKLLEDFWSTPIGSGDTVMLKLIRTSLGDGGKSVRYLAIRRGWWLKWVRHKPKKSGFFNICMDESEEQPHFVKISDAFYLRAYDQSRYRVAVKRESSASFGGRVIGLRKDPKKVSAVHPSSKVEKAYYESFIDTEEKPQFMKPLQLCASLPKKFYNPASNCGNIYNDALFISPEKKGNTAKQQLSSEMQQKYYLDVPAWIEMMHREGRYKQRVYVVRMNGDRKANSKARRFHKSDKNISFVRLRTGRNVAASLRAGFKCQKSLFGLKKVSNTFEEVDHNSHRNESSLQSRISDALTTGLDLSLSGSDDPISLDLNESTFDYSSSDDESLSLQSSVELSLSETSELLDYTTDESANSTEDLDANIKKTRFKGSAGQLKKIAKGVKLMSVKSTEKVSSISHRAGRTAFSKSMRVRQRAPKKEPKLSSSVRPRRIKNSRRRRKDHHIAIKKTLRSMKRAKRGHSQPHQLPDELVAGTLMAPDQSCRKVSQVFSELSSIAMSDSAPPFSKDAANLLWSQLVPISEFDSWFLRGGTVELGVIPTKNSLFGALLGEFVVARCLWESHWHEEACLLWDPCLAFYAPLTKKPSCVVYYVDIQQIRIVDASDYINPLPGFTVIAIETAWRCHYLAFIDEEGRANFQQKVNSAMSACRKDDSAMRNDVLWQAHLLQGFQPSVDRRSLSEGEGKWAKVMLPKAKKSKQRVIHNARRMAFDCEIFLIDGSESAERSVGVYVEGLLRQALSFSLETLMECPTDFVRFLDCASRLRMLPLHKLNLSGEEAFCICVNLYHCLLQHSLLLSYHGPPTKKSVQEFKCTNCYDIGGDCFSLAELEIRVIRGNMSKAIYSKPPFLQTPKKSHAHLAYALGVTDPRINFVLNTGDMSKVSHVPILTPKNLDEQLSKFSAAFLIRSVSVDLERKIVTLPKICEVYRNDFGDGYSLECIEYCRQYLDKETLSQLDECLKKGSYTTRYQQSCDNFYSNLKRMD